MSVLKLTFIGHDCWDRPVYKNCEGKFFKDTDPRECSQPSICTCDSFDGEPDTPLEYTSRYKDAKVEFIPSRVVW